MAVFPRRGRWTGSVAAAVTLAPALALVAATVTDRGPSGAVRFTAFPAALVAFDDFVWECVKNSLAVAAAVTFAARVVGVGVARLVVRKKFGGRSILTALVCAGVVVPPAFGAVGLRFWLVRGAFGWLPAGWDGVLPWAAWFWVALAAGLPLVVLAAVSALARVDPSWEDAARIEGAGARQIWVRIVWPVVRPEVARALGVVFTLTLVEPGAPLVLGLRRTLGYQIADAALDPGVGRLTRAAVLALGGVCLAGLVRGMIGWWGGPRTAALETVERPVARSGATSVLKGVGAALVLAAVAVLAWWPLAGLVASSLVGKGPDASPGVDAFRAVKDDPLCRRYALNSAALGLAVVAFDLLLARAIAGRGGGGRGGPNADHTESLPPLAIGVGTLAIAATLRGFAWPPAGGVAHAAADAFDPDRTPWVALVFAVGLARLPILRRSAAERRRGLSRSLVDAAVTLGAGRRQARRTLSGRLLGASPSAAVLTAALAATGVTPALVLAPTAETRPVGPAVLTLVDEPGGGFARASAMAVTAVGVNLAALAIAARGRSRLAREWFRG